MTLHALSCAVEALLVRQNLRAMQPLHRALAPGYVLRAARHLSGASRVIIGTGFPVGNTFETDGPPGAIALYEALTAMGCEAHIACADPLAAVLEQRYRVLRLTAFDHEAGRRDARATLQRLQPDAVVSIERPGLAADGRYYNMRGEDISPRVAVFDYYLDLAVCPTIGIGDGGNEIGMGNLAQIIAPMDIQGAATTCDELIVADVSNWGAFGLVTLLEAVEGRPLFGAFRLDECLAYLARNGSLDGVTRENTETEDGLPLSEGEALLRDLEELKQRYAKSAQRGPQGSTPTQ